MPASAAAARREESAFAIDVRKGLTSPQKTLPPKYLYDAVGSALFDAITELDTYGLTRADERLLAGHAAEIADILDANFDVIELGSGSGRKTRPLLEAAMGKKRRGSGMSYSAIDVSSAALERCRRELSELPGLVIHTVPASYLEGLAAVLAKNERRRPALVMFVGSSIGNFEPRDAAQFLSKLRGLLRGGDALLIGADLVKPEAQLLPAYDDPSGVTAAFNKNILVRINRELGASFDPAQFLHEARWSQKERRVEMHLRALSDMTVHVREAGFVAEFVAGETIWTESSYKFHPAEMDTLGESAGFQPLRRWIDRTWPFAECLWIAPAP